MCRGKQRCLRGAVRDAPQGEDTLNVEVVGKLQRRVRGEEGDVVHYVPLLPIDDRSTVGELNGACGVDEAVMVRPLRVGPRPTRFQVRPG